LPQAEIEVAQHFCASAVAQADAVEFGNVGQLAFPSRCLERRLDALPSSAHSCLPSVHRPGRGLLL
jgi:hypothetical protein